MYATGDVGCFAAVRMRALCSYPVYNTVDAYWETLSRLVLSCAKPLTQDPPPRSEAGTSGAEGPPAKGR
jgi:hypothetical protein